MKRERRMTLLGWALAAFFWGEFFMSRVLGKPLPLGVDLAAIAAGLGWLILSAANWKRRRK